MFYEYCQNNSGGRFQNDEFVCEFVIIEANSAKEANARAEGIGLYFDGVYDGMDCPCCGDRWYAAWGNGDEAPLLYGAPPEHYKNSLRQSSGVVYCRVFYKDGSVKEYRG